VNLSRRAKFVAGAVVALAAAAGGGVAVAGSQDSSPSSESKAIIDDAAKQLGIPSSKLSDALKTALKDRIDAAVAAGRITKAEGDAIKQRIAGDSFPLLGGLHRGFGHHVFFGRLDAAAGYLGMTESQLRTELDGGKSLAQVAKDHNKSVDGLVNALVADVKQKLDGAVSAGKLTKERETEMLGALKDRIRDMVNQTGGLRGLHFRHPALGFRLFARPTA
jgi:hypothetical protein